MGVVKNLMVRIGADVRGVVNGMKTAYSSTRQATSQIRNATAGMKQSVKANFTNSRMSVREYAESVSGLKASHNAAVQNAERLSEKISQMQSVYDSLKSTTAGLDLSTPLKDQIKNAEAAWHGILNETQKVKEALNKELSLGGSKDNSEKIASLRRDLRVLRTAASEAEFELKNLRSVAAAIGTENIQFASASGLEGLKEDIRRTQQELDVTKLKAGELGEKLKSMRISQLIKSELKSIGAAAGASAQAGLREMGSRLKSLGGSAIKGIVSLPARLLGIGKSASASNNNLERMVRSIRNLSFVAVGLRIFRGIFGELQGIISNYISQNDALSASVANLKAQLGQALAPAVNMIMVAMQRLMPVIQTIASAINAIFTALFGRVKVTASGVRSSVGSVKKAVESLDVLGFDQINKLSDHSTDDSGGDMGSMFEFGEPPEWAKKIAEWIEQMKAAFRAGDWEGLGKIFGDGINAAVDAFNAVDIGNKIGTFANNLFTTLHSALSTINFFNIGKKVGEFVTSGVSAVDWQTVGKTIGLAITALPSAIVGFILNTDWALISKSLSQMIGSALQTVGIWISNVDWLKIGDTIWKFCSAIDGASIAKGIYTIIGGALAAGIGLLTGFIGGVVEDIKVFFTERIRACGGNVAQGLLQGILDGLVNIGSWIYDNVVMPFLTAFMSLFGIHSPSTVMESLGVFLITGLLNGLTETWQMITAFFETALADLVTRFNNGWSEIQISTKTVWMQIATTISEQIRAMNLAVNHEAFSLRQQLMQCWLDIHSDGYSGVTMLAQTMKTGFQSIRMDSVKIFNDLFADLQQIWKNMVSSLAANLKNMLSQSNTVYTRLTSATETAWKAMERTTTTRVTAIHQMVTMTMNKLLADVIGCWNNMNAATSNAMVNMYVIVANGFANMRISVQNTVNAIIRSVVEMTNAIIVSVSRAADAMNSIGIGGGGGSSGGRTQDLTGGAGGTSMRLARGGIATAPTYAMIGEAGKEAVLPLENNTSWMDTLAQRLTTAGGSSGCGTPMVLQIYLGRKKLTEYVIQDINQITKTTGTCPIYV